MRRPRSTVKQDLLFVDLVEDKTRNRMVFVLAALLSYIYLTWSLYISSSTVSLNLNLDIWSKWKAWYGSQRAEFNVYWWGNYW